MCSCLFSSLIVQGIPLFPSPTNPLPMEWLNAAVEVRRDFSRLRGQEDKHPPNLHVPIRSSGQGPFLRATPDLDQTQQGLGNVLHWEIQCWRPLV